MGTMVGSSSPVPRNSGNKPLGIQLIERIDRAPLSYRSHQAIVFILTFLAYAFFRANRKVLSVVKSTLDPANDLKLKTIPYPTTNITHSPNQPQHGSGGWAPFDGANGTYFLGELDVAFLSVYALGLYLSGALADRTNIRIFLTTGMIGTALFTSLFGVGYWASIHSFYYFLADQMLSGLFQSTGWPSVLPVVGNWLGKQKRGLIMGIWHANGSVGDITGSLLGSAMLRYGWGWSFVVPALMIAFVGLAVFLFLPVSPESVGCESEEDAGEEATEPLLSSESEAIGFAEAWKIPGVASFALCLFFAKLVAYTFLYWLPFYITHTVIDGEYLSSKAAGNLSTLFDVGGVIGGILAGYISDRLNARAITAAGFMYCAIPTLFLYRTYGYISLPMNIALMFTTGLFVNGPYALITTAVSADLGTHSSLKGNARALATVTAIIDGTGSVGAAIGPLLTGYISAESWNAVFIMLMVAALIAGLLLTKLVIAEVSATIEV